MVAPDKDAGLPQPCQAVAMDPVTECLLRHTHGDTIRAAFLLEGEWISVDFSARGGDGAFPAWERYRARAG